MDFQPLASVFVLALLGLSSFFFLPPSIGGPPSPDAATTTTIANEPLQPMTTNKLFNTFASCFQNQCSGAIRYLFKPTGFAAWHNVGAGNVTLTGFSVGGQSRSVSAFSNSTTIDYRISVPNVVTMDVYFKETPTNGRPSNTFKVTMVGTSSVSGTFTWNFGNPQSFPVTCDNTKKILTYGTAGLNFTDATNFSATCTTTSVSFTIGVGAFKIDPTTVSTVTGGGTRYSKQFKCYGIAQTRYWCFYSNGASAVFRTSLDGVTWSSATIVTTVLFGSPECFTSDFDYSANRLYYVALATASTTLHWRSGVFNTDGTITWDFAEQSITTTNTNRQSCFLSGVITPNGDLIAATHTTDGGSVIHREIWKCAGASSSCTPAKLLDQTSGAGFNFAIRSFSDSSLVGAFVATGGTQPINIEVCPSTCATTTDWSSATLSTSSYTDSKWSMITVGTTLYFAGRTSATTIKYWKCSYPCSSSPSETTITSAETAINGVAITTDKSSTLAIVFSDSTANIISYFVSFNTGTSWSTKQAYVTSESNIGDASLTVANKIDSKGTLALEWFTGTANPFNIRLTSIGINGPYIIQSTSCTGTGSTVNCAFASNTKAGSSLVVFAGSTATTTVSGVTDTQSLTYSQIVGSDVGTVGDSEAWWACHPSTAAADTVTVSYSLSVTATIILYELHGRPTGTSCGPSSSTGSSASSSTAAVGSYTPRANAFIIGALDSSCQVACTITAGSGYSLDFNVAINAVNDFTTEYFWNVATADTTPYTFSVASAYNEISVAFYDLVWTNSTATDTSTVTDSPARGLSLPRAPSDTFTFVDVVTKGLFKTVSDTFTFADSAINSVIGGAIVASRQTTGAILVFGIIIVFTLIALLVFGRRR